MFDFLPTYPEKRPKKQKDDKKTTKKQKKIHDRWKQNSIWGE